MLRPRSLLAALTRPAIRLRLLAAVNPPGVLRVTEVRRGLMAVLDGFVASAEAARMSPLILLIPNKPAQRGVFDRLIFPRLSSLAETGWTAPAKKSWDRFKALVGLMPLLYGIRA